MPIRPRQNPIPRKRRFDTRTARGQIFADVKKLAHLNPDALARNLLHQPRILKDRRERLRIWDLFQQLGGGAVIRRAIGTILQARTFPELGAVLHAAAADGWSETGPAIAQRFHREIQRIGHAVPNRETIERLRALGHAAGTVRAPLNAADLSVLLKSASPRLREIGAAAVAQLRLKNLLDDCLPLCWESGPARVHAAEAAGLLGESAHAAELWSRALSARRSHRQRPLRRLLAPLGRMGAFDIQVALRAWIIEDATVSAASVWCYAEAWSQLTAAKFAAGACDRAEAIEDLRWFLSVAGMKRGANAANAPLPPAGEPEHMHGYLFLARELFRLGASADAEALLARFAAQGLPDVDHFPDLLFPGLRGYVPDDPKDSSLMWLAAMGNPDAQDRLLELWLAAFYQGRAPDHWSIHASLDPARVVAILQRALHSKTPGVLRRVLSLAMSEAVAAGLKSTIERLAHSHPSLVVRWKARRVLREQSRQDAVNQAGASGIRWVRLDAAVLSGAARLKSASRPAPGRDALPPGVLPPHDVTRGYRIDTSALKPSQRAALIRALKTAPLTFALDRQVPEGPALEDRPDVRTLRELPTPGNEIDQRMSELAQAVMQYWGDGEDFLTLDEEGVGLVATALSSDAAALDEDDREACGAFIGEALRKSIGGHWSGFDGHYVLEAGNESIDPHAWVREVCERSGILDGAEWLATRFMEAVARFTPVKKMAQRPDPIEACERILTELCGRPASTPMSELMRETRSLSYRFEPQHWPATLLSLDVLIGNRQVNRVLAALAIYAPPEVFGQLWSRWGRARREETGIADSIVEAMSAAAERDDLEAMPHWTRQPPQSRLSFLNSLRKRMDARAWRRVLLLLLRQRAAACDRDGVAWCLYSFRYEFSDCLPLLEAFLNMNVSARQTVLRSTLHCTRRDLKLFRPLWAEALRDPASAVIRAAIDAAATHRTRGLRKLVAALAHDKRETVAVAAQKLLDVWNG